MVTPVFIRQSKPDDPVFGYGDIVRIYEEDNVVFECPGSTWPNAYRYSDKTPWGKVYAAICCGVFPYLVTYRKRWGDCLLLNDGKAIPTINSNTNHNGKKIATEIFIHPGGVASKNPDNRGSRGCLTIPQSHYQAWISHFKTGQIGNVVVTEEHNFTMDAGGEIWVGQVVSRGN